MSPQPFSLLGVPLETRSRHEIATELREWLSERTPRQIVTVNPEILVAGVRDPTYRAVINAADLRPVDGAGIVFVAKLLRIPIPERLTGIELVDLLAELAASLGRSVYLVGADLGVAEAAAVELQRRHPTLRITGAEEGIPKVTDEAFRALEPHKQEAAVVERIASTRPGVVFVAFGHPKQELFIARNKERLNASILVGVGGTFDFLAGRVSRAPQVLRTLWLEWLWRLLLQPWRLRRMWDATIVFLWLVIIQRVTSHES